jgi:hypothetical protein
MNDDVKRHLRVMSMMHEALGNIIKEFHKGKENERKLSSELMACTYTLLKEAEDIDKKLVK